MDGSGVSGSWPNVHPSVPQRAREEAVTILQHERSRLVRKREKMNTKINNLDSAIRLLREAI